MKRTTVLLFFLLLGIIRATPLIAQSQPPVAQNDIYAILVSQTLNTVAGQSLLNNDSDPEGTSLLVRPRPFTAASSGTLNLNTDGTFSFTPVFGSLANVSFAYLACEDTDSPELVSQFDFDTNPLTQATVGPDASSINPNTEQAGCGIRTTTSGGSVGLDIEVPNTGNIFNFTGFRTEFTYRDQEGQADIVSGGNFRIYHITANAVGIQLNLINGDTGAALTITQNLGNFAAGDSDYTIEYDEINGDLIYTVNGSTQTFSDVAPDFSFLDSSLASGITIGERMDGARKANPSLCAIAIYDTSNQCDSATVALNIMSSVITNKRITFRVNPL